MDYPQNQIVELRRRIYAKINKEIEMAIKNNDLSEMADKYGIVLDEEPAMIVTKRMKILVLGELAGKVKDYLSVAKKKGINPENLEFIDYDQAKNINPSRLQYSNIYSDIIYGPTPHKIGGMGDTSSLLSLIEKNPNEYPKLTKAISNNQLKISITGFGDYLLKTRYFEAMALDY